MIRFLSSSLCFLVTAYFFDSSKALRCYHANVQNSTVMPQDLNVRHNCDACSKAVTVYFHKNSQFKLETIWRCYRQSDEQNNALQGTTPPGTTKLLDDLVCFESVMNTRSKEHNWIYSICSCCSDYCNAASFCGTSIPVLLANDGREYSKIIHSHDVEIEKS